MYFWTIFKGFGDIIDEKYIFYLSKFYENFRMNFRWSENVNSGVKLKTLYSVELQSNQNDFTHFVDLLSQFSKTSKSVIPKVVNDRFKKFGKTDIQNIEYCHFE